MKRGRFIPAPEPTGVTDLCGCGEEDPSEYGEGDQGHGKGVNGGDWAERERTTVAEKEEKEEVEENR